MPSFGDIVSDTPTIWTMGTWDSPLLDISKLNGSSTWSLVSWKEQNTVDETEAYVRVDILDGDKAVLLSDITGATAGLNGKQIDLSIRPPVNAVDIYLRFKLFSKDKTSPIVSDIVVS